MSPSEQVMATAREGTTGCGSSPLPGPCLQEDSRTCGSFGSQLDQLRLTGIPPPPSTGLFRASLRMHKPLTSIFGRRFCVFGDSFWGPTQPLGMQHM